LTNYSDQNLLDILLQSPNPIAIYFGKELVIQIANLEMMRFLGQDQSIIGMPLGIALAGIEQQKFLSIVQSVWDSEISNQVKDSIVRINVDRQLHSFYYDSTFQIIFDHQGKATAILHTATDVTERHMQRIALEKANVQVGILKIEELLVAELEANNKQLHASNKQLLLQQSNHETAVSKLNTTIETIRRALAQSQGRISYMLDDAPVAIAVFTGRDLVIETANKNILSVWGKDDSVLGQKLHLTLPELEGQPFLQLLDNVFTTGQPYYAYEAKIKFKRDNKFEDVYSNFVYQPLKNDAGETRSIMIVSTIITEQVKAKKELESARDILSLAIDAAGLGTWHADLQTDLMTISEKSQHMHGIPDGTTMTFTDSLEMIDPEFRNEVELNINKAIKTGDNFENEYRLKPRDNREHTWLKSTGKVTYDQLGTPLFITGAIVDITDQVLSRQRQEELNTELIDINSELKTAIEELELMNKELTATQHNLQKSLFELSESESLKEIAINQSKLGTWYINTETDEFVPSARLKEIIGYKPGEKMPANATVIHIPSEYTTNIFALIDIAISTGKSYDLEYPIIRKSDKNVRWVRATGKIYKSISGKPAHFSGTIMDMTELLNAKEELKKAEESLRMATDSAEMGTWYIELPAIKFTVSSRFKQIFGFEPADELTYDSALSQIPVEYKKIVTEALRTSINKGGKFILEFPIIALNNGKMRWVRAIGKLNYHQDGRNSHLTGLLHDITEVKQDELRKNDFIGMVSHELKTPLTSLKGYVQLLQERAKIKSDIFAMAALIKVNKQVNKMTILINDFLNVSRFESGKIFLHKEDFLLDNLTSELIEEARLMISTHVIIHECESKVSINADRDKIGAVISNLLSNAIKYSPHGKTIEIKCKQYENQAVMSVRDEGIGVNDNDIEKLFDRYYRVENKLTKTISGFGIGLYLSAEIIQRHEGKIWVESIPGQGSIFYFSLPLNLSGSDLFDDS